MGVQVERVWFQVARRAGTGARHRLSLLLGLLQSEKVLLLKSSELLGDLLMMVDVVGVAEGTTTSSQLGEVI
jgi:hypothetical protein